MSAIKNPPTFKPDEGDDYGNWKKDVEVWRLFTKEEKSRLGAALYLSLSGTARDAVRGISAETLKSDTGFDEVIKILDSVYLKDTATRAYCAFKDFVEYRRSSGDTFAVFIVEFEKRYKEVEKHEMILPTGAKAYFLLQAANLTIDNERLARATAKLEYGDMKVQIQKVFGETVGNDDETLPIKTKECNYTRGNRGGYRARGRGNYRETKYSRGNNIGEHSRNSQSGARESNETNPIGADGNIMRCHICESTKHFSSCCPHRRSEEAHVTVNITLLAGMGENEQCCLMAECAGYGVLDSACTKTVAGNVWVEEYLSKLTKEELDKVKSSERKTNSVYRFGDGVESKSVKTLNLPVLIGNKSLIIEVDVVDNKIPLLISKPTMSKLGMKIDFANHVAVVKGQSMKLGCTSSGHYCLPISCFVREDCKIVLNVDRVIGESVPEKKKKALKLHRQFCHAEKLQRLVKNAGCSDKEFIKAI